MFDLYVALGDSLSIDKYAGPGLGAASLLYADLLRHNPRLRLENLAEDGLTSHGLPLLLERLPACPGRTLVTLTIGGNDLIAGFNAGLPQADAPQFERRLEAVVARLRELYPVLTLVLATIYDPTDGTGVVQSGHARFREALPCLHEYNARLREVARRHGARLADIHGHFQGHAHEWICFDIEPNPRGSEEIRRLFREALE